MPAQLTPPTPKAAGTVPETGAICNECYRSPDSSGSGDCASPTHTATPKAAGTVPETGASCSECYRSPGSSGSDDRASPTHTTNPQSCGDCHRDRGVR
ncbi:MAG UNVERIFIED_CONTAM: hypothetical protein LVR18_28440 [Planctomycetaceae bacterium]